MSCFAGTNCTATFSPVSQVIDCAATSSCVLQVTNCIAASSTEQVTDCGCISSPILSHIRARAPHRNCLCTDPTFVLILLFMVQKVGKVKVVQNPQKGKASKTVRWGRFLNSVRFLNSAQNSAHFLSSAQLLTSQQCSLYVNSARFLSCTRFLHRLDCPFRDG